MFERLVDLLAIIARWFRRTKIFDARKGVAHGIKNKRFSDDLYRLRRLIRRAQGLDSRGV